MASEEIRRPSKYFGELTFSRQLMRERLPRGCWDRIACALRDHRPLDRETADVVAQAMREWALSLGVTHYAHWFQPMTGLTAEKHHSLIDLDAAGRPLERFSGRDLIQGEPDASSFPHGGIRSTFEARGYTAWDPSSTAFVMEFDGSCTLCIPSVYLSWSGETLDKKTPLLRSMAAVDRAARRVLVALEGRDPGQVTPYVGAEQEYFLVDQELYRRRLDLRILGATLFGSAPPKGQQMEDHYFGAIRERALGFMQELERHLHRLGVPAKTRHNEVAPNQFELAPLHEPAHEAVDHNQIVMDVLKRVAEKRGLQALLHEKPFDGLNGSGKHNNWSLIDAGGRNLLAPGSEPRENLRFLLMVLAVVRGVQLHGGLLRGIVASHGNDLRLGGNEAPPAVMSVFLGSHLTHLLENLEQANLAEGGAQGAIELGLMGIPRILRDNTDRNRTSPIAFTGSKFEFRMVGSSASIAMPNMVINAMVTEALEEIATGLEDRARQGIEPQDAALEVIRELVGETRPVRFDGNNYEPGWLEEARHRGLPILSHAPESLDQLISEDAVRLMERCEILTRPELEARHRIKLDLYVKQVEMELAVARRILRTQILPAALSHQRRLGSAVDAAVRILGRDHDSLEAQIHELAWLCEQIARIHDWLAAGQEMDRLLIEPGLRVRARACAETIRPRLRAVRRLADQLEERVEAELWPHPAYQDLLEAL